MITHLTSKFALSERRSCYLAGLSRYAYRYIPKRRNDNALRTRLLELAIQYPRYGYLMLHALLKQEGMVVNRKHTYRIYTQEKLQMRTKKERSSLDLGSLWLYLSVKIFVGLWTLSVTN